MHTIATVTGERPRSGRRSFGGGPAADADTGSATSSAARPIEVEEIALGDRTVRVPTLVEITRIKA